MPHADLWDAPAKVLEKYFQYIPVFVQSIASQWCMGVSLLSETQLGIYTYNHTIHFFLLFYCIALT